MLIFNIFCHLIVIAMNVLHNELEIYNIKYRTDDNRRNRKV